MGITMDKLGTTFNDQVLKLDRPSPKQFHHLVWTRHLLHNQTVFRRQGAEVKSCGQNSKLDGVNGLVSTRRHWCWHVQRLNDHRCVRLMAAKMMRRRRKTWRD